MRKIHTSALAMAASAAAFASPALAGPVYETASGGTFTYYGHFNPAFVTFDDGVDSYDEIGDNDSSSSRIGFRITHPLGDNELRFRFETAFGFNPTADDSQTSASSGIDWDRTALRHVDFQLVTSQYGTFYLGQGSMATDGLGDLDASGTSLAGAVAIGDIAGSYQLRTSAGALSGIEIGDAFQSFDGSRRGRIRYDTPTFNGFTVSVAYGQDILSQGNDDDFYDIGLAYETELGNGIELSAGLGYQVRERSGSEDREDTFASLAVALPSGFNVSLSVGDRNTGGDYTYIKAGYAADWFSFGETAISVDFYSGSDMVSVGDDAESIGVAITQDIDALNVEAYLGYRDYAYEDTSGTSYLDAESFVIGARWKF